MCLADRIHRRIAQDRASPVGRTVLVLLAALGAGTGATWAQAAPRVVVQGTVVDSIAGRPLPFVIVTVADTTDVSTLTDRSGRFRVRLPPGRWRLEFRKIGYRMTVFETAVTEAPSALDVFMQPLPFGLEAVVVSDSAENPANRIIREAIARKNDVLTRIRDYQYDAYVKFLVRDLSKHEDSTDALALITETQTRAYWRRPDQYQETIVARRQSSNLDAENNLVSVGQIVNFNRDRIDLAKYSVVSPTADDALEHYRYHILDTLEVGGRTAIRLAIEPRSSGSPSFVGMIDIADSTFDVLAIDVGANDAIRFDYFRNLRYRQRLMDHGDDRWMPYEIRFSGEFHIGIPIPGFPQHVSFEHVATLGDFRFDVGDVPPTLGEYLIVVDDRADDVDSTSWRQRRPTPLSGLESAAYERLDSIANEPPSVLDRMLSGVAGTIWLATRHDFFHFTRVEGPYLGVGHTWRELSPDLVLRTKLGYAIDRKEWQYRFGGSVRVSERQRFWVGATYRDEIVPRPTIVADAYNPTPAALLAKLDPLDYYREKGFSALVSTKLLDFTQLQLQYADVEQSSVEPVTDFSILATERLHRPNAAVVEGRLRSWTAAFIYDSRPLLKRGRRDYYLGMLTRTRITLGVELSKPGFVASDFDYARYFLRVHRRQRTFNWGLTTIDGYGGLSSGALPPQRYFTVDFGKGLLIEEGGFHTLDENNFAGNRAAAVVVSHDFDQLLFRKSGIPLVEKIPVTLGVHGGVFWTDFENHVPNPGDELVRTATSAYGELGFTVGNLTPFITPFNFAASFTWQLSSYGTAPFEFRIGVPTN